MLEAKLLLLIGIANGTPVIVKRILGEKLAFPLDAGVTFFDHRPVFGPSKTLRGVVSALAVTTLCAPVLGFTWGEGAVLAAAAMLGDLLSSFTKRRLNRPSSSMALGIDQIPESLFPMIVSHYLFGISWTGVAVVVILFFILELWLSKILYKLKIRKEPY